MAAAALVFSYSREILLCAFKWLLVKCLIIGRYNCNTIVFNISDILLRVNNFYLICCRDCVVNYELFYCNNRCV